MKVENNNNEEHKTVIELDSDNSSVDSEIKYKMAVDKQL